MLGYDSPIETTHSGLAQHKLCNVGRKQVVTPAGATPWVPARTRVDSTLVKAIVRADRWRDMLESGDYATVRDLAKAEDINESYLGRVLRLTLLAPKIVETILEGRQPASLELGDLLQQFPIEWDKQPEMLTERTERPKAATSSEAPFYQ